MPSDPYAVLRALLRAEAERNRPHQSADRAEQRPERQAPKGGRERG
ncbi:hypothetical protein [Streptomyces sp. B93]|nr:hypothetical protein [Streptomyces sp. B93]MBQ1093011.1 hypothetical protein [Streptomyces sp. B93]